MKSVLKLLTFLAIVANLALCVAIAMLLTRMIEGQAPVKAKPKERPTPSDEPVKKEPNYADMNLYKGVGHHIDPDLDYTRND